MTCLIKSKVACPDTYRGKYTVTKNPKEDLARLYANEIDDVIEKVHLDGKRVAAYIAESLQSCGGQIIPPDNYLNNVYK